MNVPDTWPEFDEQSRFFFERQKQIQDWWSLSVAAFQAAREMVAAIEVDPASALGDGWAVGTKLAGRDHRGTFIYRAEWFESNADLPYVALDITCDHSDWTDPAGLTSAPGRPFVGLLCGTLDTGTRLEAALRAAKPGLPGGSWKKGPVHVAYRYMPDPDWYQHPHLWRERVVDEVLKAARHYEPIVNHAIAHLSDVSGS